MAPCQNMTIHQMLQRFLEATTTTHFINMILEDMTGTDLYSCSLP